MKHLEYEHNNDKDRVVNEAKKLMLEEKNYHTDKDKDMVKDKKKYKDEYIRD